MSGVPEHLPPLSFTLPDRGEYHEILDGDEVPREELSRSLGAMGAVNRTLGGYRGLIGPLIEVAKAENRAPEDPITLLDVGTGNGNLPRSLSTALGKRGIVLRWCGIDLRRSVLEVARGLGAAEAEPHLLLQADGMALPFPDRSFDVVTSSLMLHHLSNARSVRLLEEFSRVARHRVLVSDLERHPLHYAGARLLALTVWRGDRITRVDGPLSVLRSFTRGELSELARMAPLASVEVRRSFPFRLLIDGVPE